MSAQSERQELIDIAIALGAELHQVNRTIQGVVAMLHSEADKLLPGAVEEASARPKVRGLNYKTMAQSIKETSPLIKKPRKPLSDEAKAKLRLNLTKARAARKAKPSESP